jgi:hypothetical protein
VHTIASPNFFISGSIPMARLTGICGASTAHPCGQAVPLPRLPKMLPVMHQIAIPQPLGRPRKRPQRIAGDKGYSYNRVRDWLRKCGIKPLISRRTTEKLRQDGRSVFGKQAYKHRSIIEQTNGWLKECRLIGMRLEKPAITSSR